MSDLLSAAVDEPNAPSEASERRLSMIVSDIDGTLVGAGAASGAVIEAMGGRGCGVYSTGRGSGMIAPLPRHDCLICHTQSLVSTAPCWV